MYDLKFDEAHRIFAAWKQNPDSIRAYRQWMLEAGFEMNVEEDPLVKFLVRFTDHPTRSFVKAFPPMCEAYWSGAMAFGLIAEKPL